MAHSEIFLLLHESGDYRTLYVNRSKDAIDEDKELEYLKELENYIRYYETENCFCYYDSKNISSHLDQFIILEEYYLSNPPDILRFMLSKWEDWRENPVSDGSYKIFNGVDIESHTFCEVAKRKENNPENTYLIINHESLSFNNVFINTGSRIHNIEIKSLKDSYLWFSENRRPERVYHPSDKHGENGRGMWDGAAPLKCSHVKAEILMKKAICDHDKRLYYYDEENNSYMIFRYEGQIPVHLYHAYHISDREISKSIKKLVDYLCGI